MLKGKTAFITGANRGIGKAIFDRFIKNGADIICAVRKKKPLFLKYVLSQEKKYKKKIRIIEFDLENDNKIKKAIQLLYKEKVVIDILINNAGIADGSLIEMTSPDNIKKVFEINFFSQIRITQLLLRLIKKSKAGSIINIGSLSGIVALRGAISYGSSKAALMYATKVMAEEFSIYKIRVNSIAPNVTNSDMMKLMNKDIMKKLLKKSNLKKPHTVNQVADLALFLASEKSLNKNGKIIKITGKK